MPKTMTAIEITEPGGPEVLQPIERPVPSAAHGEVLLRVEAAGVNRPDVLQRLGGYPPPPGASDIPGLEVAGTVVALGAGDTGWQIGDGVCALVSGGGYAEYCTAPAAQCLRLPTGFDMIRAGALPETYFTVWENVFRRAKLVGGERFLVHGGSSGIGTTAIQIAAARGARVFTTAGSVDKCAACEGLGAERAINYRDEDFLAVILELTDGEGVDVILDMVGGDYMAKNVKALRTEGRLVQIAFLNGSKIEFNFLPVMLKRLSIMGSTLRPRSIDEKSVIAEDLKREVWPLLDTGRIAPLIDSTYPLAQASEAHARMESSAHTGKIMLTI
jgi:putative PIG3 family NAD(P)H quinone oxidoreductase